MLSTTRYTCVPVDAVLVTSQIQKWRPGSPRPRPAPRMAPRVPMEPPRGGGRRKTDPNTGHRLLPDCVLHNVLAMLYVPDAVHVATAARGFCDAALRVPQINCCEERPAKDGVSTLVRVLSRFKNRISALHVGNMEGIPMPSGQENPRSDGIVMNMSKDVEKRMAAVFKYLDNLHDLSMHNLRLILYLSKALCSNGPCSH